MTLLTDALTSRLHQAAHAQCWNVSVPAFAAALERSVAKLGGGADGAAVERHLDGLQPCGWRRAVLRPFRRLKLAPDAS